MGMVISQNMNWTDHVNETIRKCKFKLRSLKKLSGEVTEAVGPLKSGIPD